MTIPNPWPYYRVQVDAGPYSWTVEREADTPPPEPDYGLADPLRIKVGIPNGDLIYKHPDPTEGTFSLIVETMADVAGLDVGTPVHVRMWAFPDDVFTPEVGAPYDETVNVRGRIANLDATPHTLGMLITCRFVDYATDLAEMTIGQSDWPAENVNERLDRIAGELDVAAFPTGVIPSYGDHAARSASPAAARQLIVAFLDGVGVLYPVSYVDQMGNTAIRLFITSAYDSPEDPAPSAQRFAIAAMQNRNPYLEPGELPAILGEVEPGVWGVVIDDTPPEKLARIIPADHVLFTARYTLEKSNRVNSWSIALGDGNSEVVVSSGDDDGPVQGRLSTTALDPRDGRAVGIMNLNGSDSDGWAADKFTWLAHLDPHRLHFPHRLFWDDLNVSAWTQYDPLVIDGIPTHQNPTGESWYAGQITSAELTLARGRYTVELETRRNLPLVVPSDVPDPEPIPPDLTDYIAEVLTDSPTVYSQLRAYDDALGAGVDGFEDESGNSRHINVLSGTAPSTSAGSPAGGGTADDDSASWGTSPGHVRTTYTMAQPTFGTYEFWIYLTANPAAQLVVCSWSANSGGEGCCSFVSVLATGQVRLTLWQGAFVHYTDPGSLTLNTWHHVAASWNAAGGATVRINKTTVASGGPILSATPGLSSFRLHGQYDGANNTMQTGAIRLAHVAWYPTKLSTARTDAHYDAMLAATSPPPADGGTGEYFRVTDLVGTGLVPGDLDPNMSAFDARLLRSEF